MTPRSTHLLSEIETPLEKHEAEQTSPKTEKPAVRADPVALLQQLFDSGQGLSAEAAHAYLEEVHEDRALSGLRLV